LIATFSLSQAARVLSTAVRVFLLSSLLGLILTGAACHGSPAQAPDGHRHELNLPPVGPTIAASFEGKTVDVDLSTVAQESGSNSVALASVFQAAFPSVPRTGLHFDLVGSDGFRPMSRPKCTRLLSGDELAKAHLDPVTHDVSYDADVKLPGCYRVRAVVRIEATR
jgi:hypothetical protein